MNILFLGLQYDRKKEDNYIKNSKIGLQGAVNTFQWNLLDGLIENNCDVSLYNTVPVGTYPQRYDQLIFKTLNWDYERIKCKEIGFINLPIVKQYMREKEYIKYIDKWINEIQGEKVIIAYSLYLPYLNIFSYVKKHYPNVKLSMVIADLPCHYGILPNNKFKAFFMNLYGEKTLALTKNIDLFILLTEQMKEPLNIGSRPYVVIEGICSGKYSKAIEKSETKKIILYTGTLNCQFGISNLMNAFELIKDPNYELWICGSGEAEIEIKKQLNQNKRIKYFGYLNKNTIEELQQKATVLINPRQNIGEYTKYSFPSKTMEYMASGVPVLMYKLDGIPDDYDPYLFYVGDDLTAEALCARLREVCELPQEERSQFGAAARDFVLQEKSNGRQAKKIIAMLEKIL